MNHNYKALIKTDHKEVFFLMAFSSTEICIFSISFNLTPTWPSGLTLLLLSVSYNSYWLLSQDFINGYLKPKYYRPTCHQQRGNKYSHGDMMDIHGPAPFLVTFQVWIFTPKISIIMIWASSLTSSVSSCFLIFIYSWHSYTL